MIQILVFAPLLAAIVAGLGNRSIGSFPAKLITTGALFLSCALALDDFRLRSWPAAAMPMWRLC